MPWGIAASVAVGLYSASQQKSAANKATKAQQDAANQSNDTQRYMFDQSRQDQMPWLTTGASALNKLGVLYGLNTTTPAANQPMGATAGQTAGIGDIRFPAGAAMGQGGGAPGMQVGYEQAQPVGQPAGQTPNGIDPRFADFYNSPDYQFALQQGTQTLDRSAAARGRLYSGGYGEDLTKYGQGMAAQQLGNYTNRLAAIAGVGQTTATNMAGQGQNFANQFGQNLNNAADARASGYAATANANSNLANGLNQGFQYYMNQRNGQGGGF